MGKKDKDKKKKKGLGAEKTAGKTEKKLKAKLKKETGEASAKSFYFPHIIFTLLIAKFIENVYYF